MTRFLTFTLGMPAGLFIAFCGAALAFAPFTGGLNTSFSVTSYGTLFAFVLIFGACMAAADWAAERYGNRPWSTVVAGFSFGFLYLGGLGAENLLRPLFNGAAFGFAALFATLVMMWIEKRRI